MVRTYSYRLIYKFEKGYINIYRVDPESMKESYLYSHIGSTGMKMGVITLDDKYLYVLDIHANVIWQYSINNGGRLLTLSPHTICISEAIITLTYITPGYLIGKDKFNKFFELFKINENGLLIAMNRDFIEACLELGIRKIGDQQCDWKK